MREKHIPANRLPDICACGQQAFVSLTRGRVALFSPRAFAIVDGWNWSLWTASPRYLYARTLISGKQVSMHRLLAGAPQGQVVDHRNGDGLDNRDENLRVCTTAENLKSRRAYRKTKASSPFKGVIRRGDHFRATVGNGGKLHRIGTFSTEIEAARAYDRAALELHGEFALTNAMLGLLPPEDATTAPRDLFS